MPFRLRPAMSRRVEVTPLPGMAEAVLEYEIRTAVRLDDLFNVDEFMVYHCTLFRLRYGWAPSDCCCAMCLGREPVDG